MTYHNQTKEMTTWFLNFLKFVVHRMNSEIVKTKIVMLTVREKTNMTNIDVVVNWMV
jgi:hypothetical protein